LLACADSRTARDTSADTFLVDVVIDGDDAVQQRSATVDASIAVRRAGEAAWHIQGLTAFEFEALDAWPLHTQIELTSEGRGSECQLRVMAADANGNSLAEAKKEVSLDRARRDGLRVALELRAALAQDAGEPGLPPEIAPECVGRETDVPFCDGEAMRVCSSVRSENDSVRSSTQPCAEHERCVAVSNVARCDCAPGFVRTEGACAVPMR
jgi:hypothetical protein